MSNSPTLTDAQRRALAALLAVLREAGTLPSRAPYREASDLGAVSGSALAALVRRGYAETATGSAAYVAAYRPAPRYRITGKGWTVALAEEAGR